MAKYRRKHNPKRDKTRDYINNEDLYAEMVKYKQLCLQAEREGKPRPVASDYIGRAIMSISEKLASKFNFASYSYRDEMVLDGIENVVRYSLNNFDPLVTKNPFAYFTTAIYHAFLKRLAEEDKQNYLKYKNFQKLLGTEGDDGAEYSDEFFAEQIEKFESKKKK